MVGGGGKEDQTWETGQLERSVSANSLPWAIRLGEGIRFWANVLSVSDQPGSGTEPELGEESSVFRIRDAPNLPKNPRVKSRLFKNLAASSPVTTPRFSLSAA